MKFFSNCWKYLAFLFAGIIAGMVAAIKLIEKPSVLNVSTDTFVAEQTRKIGKIKQRGAGNICKLPLPEIDSTRKEFRKSVRAARRERRLKKDAETEEQASEDN